MLLGPLASLPAGITGTILMVYFSEVKQIADLHYLIETSITIGMAGAYYAYPFTLLYGLPVFLILRQYNYERLWLVVFLSVIPVYLLSGGSIGGRPNPLLVTMSFAIWISVTCWLIAVWLPNFRSNNSLKNGTPRSGAP